MSKPKVHYHYARRLYRDGEPTDMVCIGTNQEDHQALPDSNRLLGSDLVTLPVAHRLFPGADFSGTTLYALRVQYVMDDQGKQVWP